MGRRARIGNYLRQQVGIVFLEFNSEKEIIETAKEINELICPVVV